MLIGAPRGNYTRSKRDTSNFKLLNEPGVVYQCSFVSDLHTPGPCVEIRPTVLEDEELYIHQINMHARVKKKYSWFGAAMSIEKNSGFLTVYIKDMRN